MTISRRVFVKAGGLALFSFGLDPLFLARAAFAVRPSARLPDRRILVCLFQRGAVDGLNMIVPHGDPLYYRERPRIAVPQSDVVDMDGHFDLQAFGLRAPQPAARDRLTRAFEELYAGSATGLLSTSSQEAFEAVQMLKQVSPDQYRPGNGADYPRGRLGKAMMQIAQLIKADVGLQLAFADVTGWDTHVNQGSSDGQLAARLADFGQALAAFAQDLGERLRDVVVLTMSEFGRTVRENGNSGTDHGHATAMLVLGGPVNGGRMLGRWPGLDPADRFEGRDVAVTTDFRDLFSEILARHLGANELAAIFPGFTPDPARFPGAIRG